MSLEKSGGFRSRSKSGKAQAHKHSSRQRDDSWQQRKTSEPHNRRYQVGGDPRLLNPVDIARAIAFDVIYRVDVHGTYANLALPKMLRDYRIKRRDAAFATELTYGTLRVRGVLDAVIAHCSERPIANVDLGVLNALRLGAYQLLYTRVEPHAAVDTSVNIVHGIGQEKAKGFANAILREISRTSPEKWLFRVEPIDPLAGLAFRHAHPLWIARSFAQTLGLLAEDGTITNNYQLEAALRADSERPEVHLVARPGEISAEELALITGGEQGKYSPYAVILPGGDPSRLDPVQEGLAAVQDEGSQIVARAVVEAQLEGTDSGRWLDLCAGPGGKAALMACLARIDGAHVDAVEIQPHRAELIEKATEGLPITVYTDDGRDPNLEAGYDRVLVDAPCSGLGALRRRPEARWRKQESDIADLVTLQRQLLESAINLVREGGIVVYSTCSPDIRETREIVDHAVATLPVVELDAAELVPAMGDTGEQKSVQMWPHLHGTDAMFFSVLRKQSHSKQSAEPVVTTTMSSEESTA